MITFRLGFILSHLGIEHPNMSTPIPQPPTVPFLGNVLDIDPKNSMQSLVHLGEKYGM